MEWVCLKGGFVVWVGLSWGGGVWGMLFDDFIFNLMNVLFFIQFMGSLVHCFHFFKILLFNYIQSLIYILDQLLLVTWWSKFQRVCTHSNDRSFLCRH